MMLRLLQIVFLFAGLSHVKADRHLLDVELIADLLENPLDLTYIPGDTSGKRFVVEQDGRVFIMAPDNSIDLKNPFLDIQERTVFVYAFDERGLLGFAFHPKHSDSDNGKVYVLYSTDRAMTENLCYSNNGTIPDQPEDCPDQHAKRVSEFTVMTDNPNAIDESTEKVLMELEFPTRKHNGGGLRFGPGT
jgi:hypothetical protein